jgi:inorganic triphosphatase YgiF
LGALPAKKLRRLQPLFETRVERTTIPTRSSGGSEIEISIDRGRVVNNRASEQFCEVELELKRGAPAALAEIAARLSNHFPVALGALTKADRGFALQQGKKQRAPT